jgi:hypothetical protein
MRVLIYRSAGHMTAVEAVTAVERRLHEIVCLQGDTVVAAYPHTSITAYAVIPEHQALRLANRSQATGHQPAAGGLESTVELWNLDC